MKCKLSIVWKRFHVSVSSKTGWHKSQELSVPHSLVIREFVQRVEQALGQLQAGMEHRIRESDCRELL